MKKERIDYAFILHGRKAEFPLQQMIEDNLAEGVKTYVGFERMDEAGKHFSVHSGDQGPLGYVDVDEDVLPNSLSKAKCKDLEMYTGIIFAVAPFNGRKRYVGKCHLFAQEDATDDNSEDEPTKEVRATSMSNDIFDTVAQAGIAVGMDKEEARNRCSLLRHQYKLNDEEIKKVITYWRKPDDEVKSFIPSLDKVIYQDDEERHFYRVLGHVALNGTNAIRLVGSMSTGKNVFIESLAALLYQPLLEVDMQRNTEAEDFEGRDTLSYQEFKADKVEIMNFVRELEYQANVSRRNMSDGERLNAAASVASGMSSQIVQTIDFVKQPLVLAMEHGCWVNFNELNFAQAYILARLHRVLDTRQSIYIPSIGEVKAKDGFAFLSTMNPPKGGYVGTGYMNEAFETRLMTIYLEPTKHIDKILANKYPKADKQEIAILNKIYERVYSAYETGHLSEGFLALRRYEAALLEKGFGTLKMSAEDHLMNVSCNDEDARLQMKDILSAVIL